MDPLLLKSLTTLYVDAGAPPVRRIADLAGELSQTTVSQTTVHAILSNRVERVSWVKLQAVIAALGGDPDELYPLWKAQEPPVRQAGPAARVRRGEFHELTAAVQELTAAIRDLIDTPTGVNASVAQR